jgi:hypothetical protein
LNIPPLKSSSRSLSGQAAKTWNLSKKKKSRQRRKERREKRKERGEEREREER